MAPRTLLPADIVLRHGRRYQLARRLFLTLSVALTVVVPLWHLRALDAEGAGFAGQSPWWKLAGAGG